MRQIVWGTVRAAALGAVIAAPVALAEVPERPTFTKDVLPILQENCVECHRTSAPGTSGMVAPMPMTTYEETRPWAKAIAKAVESKYMPPWFATEEFHGVFRNERTLTQDEIETIVKWVQTGAARGNPADAPEPRVFENKEWWLGQPDLVVEFPEPLWVGDDVQDWQPNIMVPLTEEMLPEDRWMRMVESQPGCEVVHHVVLYTTHPGGEGAESSFGYQIGGLAPGAEPSLMQDGYGILIKKGSTLRINMHYNKEKGPGTGVYDNTKIGFFFYPKDAKVKQVNIEPIGNMDFEIPPSQDHWRVGMARTFERPFSILHYLPHMHVRGTAAKYTAYFPDGKEEVLLDVPKYDYNWQLAYEYDVPRVFPAGTRIEVEMVYDNSAANTHNPDPSVPIRFGLETTTAEMALGWMYYTWEDQAAPAPESTASTGSEIASD